MRAWKAWVAIVVAGSVIASGSGRITPDDEGSVGGWSASEAVCSVAIGQPPAGTGAVNFSGAIRDEEDGHYSEWAVGESATFRHAGDGGPSLGDYPGNITSLITRGGSVDGTISSILNLLNAERTIPTQGTYTQYSGVALPNQEDGNWPASAGIDLPGDIAFDSSGNLFLADRGHNRIVKFVRSSGRWVYAAATGNTAGSGAGSGNGQFGGSGQSVVINLAVDSSDRIYATDPWNSRVQRFSNSLGYQDQFGTPGTGNGQFGTPGPVGIDINPANGEIYVTDWANSRVQVFNSSHTYQRQWSVGHTGLYSLEISPSGEVYVTVGYDFFNESDRAAQIFVYSTSGSLLRRIGSLGGGTGPGDFSSDPNRPSPYDISFDSLGRYYALDLGNNRIQRFLSDDTFDGTWGSFGSGPGQFSDPRSVALDPAGAIYVSDYGNNRVVTYTPGGEYLQSLSDYYQSYVESCIPGHAVDYQASDDPDVIYPGFTGNVWTKLNELAQANAQEIAVINGVITIRDIVEREISAEMFAQPPTISVNTQGLARSIDIVYQNIEYGDGVVMYDAQSDNNRIFQIAAGKKETFTIALDDYPVFINNPVPTGTLPIGPGQYYVSGSDNLPVVAQEWLDYGGNVEVEIGSNPNEINITLTGPGEEIPGVPGPYYLAVSDGQTNYATLSVTGAGVKTDPRTLHLHTGADPELVTEEIGTTVTNIFIDTEAQAYDRGVWASDRYTGPNVTLAGEIDLSACEGFGLTPGAWIGFADSKYRIETVNLNNARASITAVRHVTAGDEADLWSNLPEITNLSENPSIEANTTDFAAGAGLAAMTRSGDWAASGDYSLRLSANSNSDAFAAVGNAYDGTAFLPWSVEVGHTYTISADVHSVHPGGGSWLTQDAGKIAVYYHAGTTAGLLVSSDPLDEFTTDAHVAITFTVPQEADGIRIEFWATGIGTGWYAYWDAFMLTESGYDYPFFDGNTSGASWTGTPDNSASTKPPSSAGDYAAYWAGEPAKNAIIRPLRTPGA